MESGIATFTGTLSTPPRPAAAAFLRHSGPIFSQCHNNFRHFFPITTTSSSGLVKMLDAAEAKAAYGTYFISERGVIHSCVKIDDTTADFIISQLLLLDSEDQQKDIKLFINSPGGSVTAGMGIYDAMKLCKADVSTICMGLAASMGAFLLASGSKGKRFCMPNARVMIHQPLGTAGGKATEMSIRIREMAYHKVKLNKILSRATGKPEQQIELDTDRDNFMNAWEAKEYGLVDAVIDDGKPGLVAPIADASPPPKTRVWDLWKIEGSKKAKNNLPSEEKILHNGYASGQGNDEEQGTTQN
ncbi:UNVERIFIED_CONTAM: ATP-dependent Clp protease proteolytic subunit, chloroplastic [Sesamum radiatum]|uniref:ATP-dependent Clp protease proteolytic subunit n=1 Tax=Sesamum radiatum TaxID=300843 RepID=A0AAW2V3Y1_SESRA